MLNNLLIKIYNVTYSETTMQQFEIAKTMTFIPIRKPQKGVQTSVLRGIYGTYLSLFLLTTVCNITMQSSPDSII